MSTEQAIKELPTKPHARPTAESLLAQVKAIAERLGTRFVSGTEFERGSGISRKAVYKYFDSWNEFVRAAGLEPTRTRIEDDDLFRAMKDAFLAAGGICTQAKFNQLCAYDRRIFRRRHWGDWQGMLTRFHEWATINAPDFPFLSELAAQANAGKPMTYWPAKGGPQYGPLLNFRGLMHAPRNEQGVVFLFGMVALELGYVVESLTAGFPDCEAKRQVSKPNGAWERVRIEFEFESRAFLAHGHDPADCDVIVCWEHNWPEAPIEVLELKGAIRTLQG
jgi:hypothetical protein